MQCHVESLADTSVVQGLSKAITAREEAQRATPGTLSIQMRLMVRAIIDKPAAEMWLGELWLAGTSSAWHA